ncbi:MAG: sulfite exporter TauE/SafE family protein [Caulobacterales bacterium]|nr:sulfite exporter TauE/SafE family protein [Caulobacterales bacterium]
MDASLLLMFAALVGAGAFAGLIAGMFGVGGGIVIVPALYHVFGAAGAGDEVRMHAAVGTSLATIIATSIRSALAHRKHGAVDTEILRAWAPWIFIGAFVGALVARFVPGTALTLVFALGGLGVAIRMVLRSNGESSDGSRAMPTGLAQRGLGAGLGLFSSWMGIGGGMLGVFVMTLAGRPIHQAVGTSAAFGAAIGAPGALGFMLAGWGAAGLPAGSLGYVNLPGFVVIAALTTTMAPIGARIAHSLERRTLSLLFAAMAFTLSGQMLWETIGRITG